MPEIREIGVVHLVRAVNGLEPFKRFVDSYRRFPGGKDHDLIIVLKGFSSGVDPAEYLNLVASFRHVVLHVPDIGFDITAYFAAVRQFGDQYRYFCFLNSYSEFLDGDWLEKLHHHISRPGVGLVGASGSWQSHAGGGIGWPWKFLSVARDHYRLYPRKAQWERLLLGWIGARNHYFLPLKRSIHLFANFRPFPNYHIRTNAFMATSTLLRRIHCPIIATKGDAYKFESGRRGLTIQVLKEGLRVLVVGRDGIGYERETWNESHTFWQAEQENLLVGDNQTREYQRGSPERRAHLYGQAWKKPI